MPVRHESLQWTLILTLALQLFWGAGGVRLALASEEPAVEPPAAEEPAPRDRSLAEDIEKRVDETHASIEQNILDQVIRLDDFFGNVRTESHRQTSYKLRWRNSFRAEQDGTVKFDANLRANLILSKISERLRLSISGENQDEPLAPSLPEDPGNPGFDRTSQATSFVNTELRYSLLHTPLADMFLGVGVRVAIPLEPFVRSRMVYTHPLGDASLIRFGETLFVKYGNGIGETSEISMEHMLGEKRLLRWAGTGTVSMEFEGLEWGTELSWIREFSQQSAITLTGGLYGNTHPSAVVGTYRVLTRFRRNFLREWLFYELEPEVFWPRSTDGSYSTKFAMTFRLELVFHRAGAKAGTP